MRQGTLEERWWWWQGQEEERGQGRGREHGFPGPAVGGGQKLDVALGMGRLLRGHHPFARDGETMEAHFEQFGKTSY